MSKSEKKFSFQDVIMIIVSIISLILSFALIVFSIKHESTSLSFTIIFLAFLATVFLYFYFRESAKKKRNTFWMLVFIVTISFINYYLPEFISAAGSILGITSFLYLFLDKIKKTDI